MTEKEKDGYIELLKIVDSDTQFLAELAKQIAAHVTETKERFRKLREALNGD